ncbi:unnamed protein product [Urochloa humidicola]
MAWCLSPKDPTLEAALRHNRRWVVNNQIKRLLLRMPSRARALPLVPIQSRLTSWATPPTGLASTPPASRSSMASWTHFGFTKRMAMLVDVKEAVIAASEPTIVGRLARVVMLARGRRLQVSNIATLRGPLDLPDDYLLRLLPADTDLFRLANMYPHRRNAAELELVRWAPSLVVSVVEAGRETKMKATSCKPVTKGLMPFLNMVKG